MGEVAFSIAGRRYQLVCDDGQEARLAALASSIDKEASKIAASGGQISEARLLVMSALLIADQLDETKQALAKAEQAASQPSLFEEGEAEAAIDAIDAAAERIDAMASIADGDDGADDDEVDDDDEGETPPSAAAPEGDAADTPPKPAPMPRWKRRQLRRQRLAAQRAAAEEKAAGATGDEG